MKQIVWACPHNGSITKCQTCRRPHPHRREELASSKVDPRPRCDVHDTDLVAQRTRP